MVMTGGFLKFIKQLRKVCTHSKGKNVFFGLSISKFTKQNNRPARKDKNVFFKSSISKFTKHYVWPTIRAKKLLDAHLDDDCIWNNTNPCDVSLDNTSNSEEPVNSTSTTTSIGIENNSNATQNSVDTTTTIIMSEENEEIWYNTNKEYDLWHDATETMDNYQEWISPPTIVGDTNTINPIINYIDPHIHQGDEHTNIMKSTISTPNSGWQFLHSMLYKNICCMLILTFKARFTICKTVVYVIETLSEVVILKPIAIYKWFNKHWIQHTKKYRKTSNGSEKFSHNLRASKKSCHNKRNCKSGRHDL